MSCGICSCEGHNRATCPYDGPRLTIAGAKSAVCECCGRRGRRIERHHTRGRSDASDYLDICRTCHLECGHRGDFNNLPLKPRICSFTGKASYWRRGNDERDVVRQVISARDFWDPVLEFMNGFLGR